MTAVGFEPTQLSLVELESTPLDHSGKLSMWAVFGEQAVCLLNGVGRDNISKGCCFGKAQWHVGLWRNGSASDSRSEGWEFESLWPHFMEAFGVRGQREREG